MLLHSNYHVKYKAVADHACTHTEDNMAVVVELVLSQKDQLEIYHLTCQ